MNNDFARKHALASSIVFLPPYGFTGHLEVWRQYRARPDGSEGCL